LLVRRNQADPACRVYLVYLVGPGDLACPASRACQDDPAYLVHLVHRGAMACPACRGARACQVSVACRAGGHGRANGGRARGGRDNRPYRRMR
jgi:hypothetical protein